MNILILDDEIYLAQKVLARLLEDGHNCDHFISIEEVEEDKPYDTVLLSTNLSNTICNKVLRKYKNSDIILLVSYVSDATVTNPLKSGAVDYVLKPFIMDELVRKIEHFRYFKEQETKLQLYNHFFDFVLKDIKVKINRNITLPLLIEASNKNYLYKVVFDLEKKIKKEIKFLSFKEIILEDFRFKDTYLYVITDYHLLKNSSKELLNELIEGKSVILQSNEFESFFAYNKIVFESSKSQMENTNEIMSINDYVKLIIVNFQAQYPDTELSRRLGMSRKSLWEKRKKFGIEKLK
jgi:DNA-binding NtrC family response regulator